MCIVVQTAAANQALITCSSGVFHARAWCARCRGVSACRVGSGRRPSRASWALRLAFGVGGRVVARGDPHERRGRCGWLLGLREELLPGGRVGRGVCVGSETLTSVVGAAVGFWGWGLGEELLPGGDPQTLTSVVGAAVGFWGWGNSCCQGRPSRASWVLRLAFGVGGRVVARGCHPI